jgi:GR25 family glycosyltransferase involved in LPS biosynthesis
MIKKLIIVIIILLIGYAIYYVYQINKMHFDLDSFIDNINYYNKLNPPLQKISIPVYYINMDKSKERNEWMVSQLSKNVEKYKRIRGVNGYDIKNKSHDTIDGLEFFNDFSTSLSEIGCLMSHLKAIKTAYEDGEDTVIIMEDDAYLDIINLLDFTIEELVTELPRDWEILQLAHLKSGKLKNHTATVKTHDIYKHARGYYPYYCTAYIINRKGMESVLNKIGSNPFYFTEKISDKGVSDTIIYDVTQTYIIKPSIIAPYNKTLKSTIHDSHTTTHLFSIRDMLDHYRYKFDQKYIICYPFGGLCDTVNRIYECYKYAKKYNRFLIVDTTHNWMKDDIQNYFTLKSHVFKNPSLINELLTRDSIYPPKMKDKKREDMKRVQFNNKNKLPWSSYCEFDNTDLSISLKMDYSQNIIVYSDCGGGDEFVNFLRISEATPIVKDVFLKRRQQLPDNYISVHIRNTDYKSDVNAFIEKYADVFLVHPIFLASDHKETIDLFKQKFPNVYSFANIQSIQGGNLHEGKAGERTGQQIQEFNIDCIVDILLLASGSTIYFSSQQSGFSKTAKNLLDNKDVLNNFLTLKPRVCLLSFANTLYYDSLDRIQQEAKSLPIDTIYAYKDTDLWMFPDFYHKHYHFIKSNKRGYGYWIWKPYLTLMTLSLLNENDILVYADAGCTIQASGLDRFNDYIKLVNESKTGIVSFQLDFKEKQWTKMDLYHHLDATDHLEAEQLLATVFIVRKCDESVAIIKKWYETSCHYNLLDDSNSVAKNDPSFKEHRHDQSIFSLIRHQSGSTVLPDETNPNNKTYPLLATRKKSWTKGLLQRFGIL